jgi:hypothetical protein
MPMIETGRFDESALDASTEATNEGPLCANTGRLQTDSVRPYEVLIEERLTSFNVSRWTATFSLCCFIFFLEAFFKIWESEHKLGAHRIGAERPSIARLPHISFQTVAYHPYLSGPASTKSLHLNQDLTNFLSRRKRGESNGILIRVMSIMESNRTVQFDSGRHKPSIIASPHGA